MTVKSLHQSLVVAALVGLFLTGAAAIQLMTSSQRPMHTDEAVQAYKTGILMDQGVYQYDPNDHHGPTLYYLSLPILYVQQATSFQQLTDKNVRMVIMVFALMLLAAPLMLQKETGIIPALSLVAIGASSTCLTFYSGYYVHEILFVLFSFGVIISLWRLLLSYQRTSIISWSFTLGMFLGLMISTKETFVLVLFAIAVSLFCLKGSIKPRFTAKSNKLMISGLVLIPCLVVTVLFYTSYLTHPSGILDFLTAWKSYFSRAGGEGSIADHHNPWYFYLRRLLFFKNGPGPFWGEELIVLFFLIGAFSSLKHRWEHRTQSILARFLTIYTITLLMTYTLIPYKTPWLILGPLHGMLLVGGMGLTAIFQWAKKFPARKRLLFIIVILAMILTAVFLKTQFTIKALSVFSTDYRNPWVYAHTVPDAKKLSKRIHDLNNLSNTPKPLVVKFITNDYWPLPWYLKDLHVGYWNTIPEDPDSPIIVTSPYMLEELEPRLTRSYQKQYYGLRPEVPLIMLIENSLWDSYIESISSE